MVPGTYVNNVLASKDTEVSRADEAIYDIFLHSCVS